MLDERLVALETKLAYQEAAVETLSTEIARQQRVIDQLQAQLREVLARLPQGAEGAARGSLQDEVPPHW